jgi:hypothetical protein
VKSTAGAMARKGLYGLASKAGEAAAINWYPGHMASATKAIRERIKVVDLVVEVRDARVRYPSTSISPTLPEPPWKENDAC